jgi:hypothetical protein
MPEVMPEIMPEVVPEIMLAGLSMEIMQAFPFEPQFIRG